MVTEFKASLHCSLS